MKQLHFTVILLTLSAGLIVAPFSLRAAVVTNATEASLRDAIAKGGRVTFSFDGTIKLTKPITISRNVTVDGTGRNVTISGNNAVRIFNVSTGVQATLVHLNLVNGRRLGANGTYNPMDQTSSPGQSVYGGALYNQGSVNLLSCVFSNNVATGGANGPVTTTAGTAGGGAIYNKEGSLNITNCTFLTNRVSGGEGLVGWSGSSPLAGEGLGGAIYNEAGKLNLSQCSLSVNSATGGGGTQDPSFSGGSSAAAAPGYGGALHSRGGSVTIQQCVFDANGVVGGAYSASGLGGALSGTNAILTCTETIWLNNRAESGYFDKYNAGQGHGGAVYYQGEAAFHNCIFISNSAGVSTPRTGGFGGAVYALGAITFSGCSLVENLALGGLAQSISPFGGPSRGGPGGGGGIYCGGKLQITNSTLAGNLAQGGGEGANDYGGSIGGEGLGGGIFCASGEVDLVNVTLANNRAVGGTNGAGTVTGQGIGGGIHNTNGTVRLFNTIVAYSTSGSNCFGTLVDGGHNLSSDGSCNFTAPGSLNHTDPKLGPLADNGGPTPTMALLSGSPAINAGNDAVAPATDQRGVTRPQGGHVDIGAFEVQLGAVQALPSGRLSLSFTITPHQACTLQFSTDLVHWTDLAGAAAGTNGGVNFEVPKDQPARFFRLKMP